LYGERLLSSWCGSGQQVGCRRCATGHCRRWIPEMVFIDVKSNIQYFLSATSTWSRCTPSAHHALVLLPEGHGLPHWLPQAAVTCQCRRPRDDGLRGRRRGVGKNANGHIDVPYQNWSTITRTTERITEEFLWPIKLRPEHLSSAVDNASGQEMGRHIIVHVIMLNVQTWLCSERTSPFSDHCPDKRWW